MTTTEEALQQVKENNRADYDAILLFAEVWTQNQFKSFSNEDLKKAYYKSGGAEPDEPRIYGPVMRKLSKDKIIFRNGYENSKENICHNGIKSLWISKAYRIKQQANAKREVTMKLF